METALPSKMSEFYTSLHSHNPEDHDPKDIFIFIHIIHISMKLPHLSLPMCLNHFLFSLYGHFAMTEDKIMGKVLPLCGHEFKKLK
jgi:hypothetical protein